MDKWERKFNKYVKSKKHLYDCIGYSEGQECCLEKPWIKKFIRKLLKGKLSFIALGETKKI